MPEHLGSLAQSPSPKLGHHWFSESDTPTVPAAQATCQAHSSPGPLLTAILPRGYSCAHFVDEKIEVLGDKVTGPNTYHELKSVAEDPSSHSSWVQAEPRIRWLVGIYYVAGTVSGTLPGTS